MLAHTFTKSLGMAGSAKRLPSAAHLAFMRRADPRGVPAAMHGRLASGVDQRHLAEVEPLLAALEGADYRLGPVPAGHEVQRAGPSRGSAMLWIATAPTPARTKAQRAVTAMNDEATAIPIWPVSAQRPMIEKVMRPSAPATRTGGMLARGEGRRAPAQRFLQSRSAS